jgi:hypothetical protein
LQSLSQTSRPPRTHTTHTGQHLGEKPGGAPATRVTSR